MGNDLRGNLGVFFTKSHKDDGEMKYSNSIQSEEQKKNSEIGRTNSEIGRLLIIYWVQEIRDSKG